MALQSVRGGVMGMVMQTGTTFPKDLERTDEFHERFPRDLLAGVFWRGGEVLAGMCLGALWCIRRRCQLLGIG